MAEQKAYYTDDELVERLMDKEAVKDLMARHSYYYSNDQRRQELSDIWVSTPHYRRTASLANNFGYYVGMDDISNYYVVQHNTRRYEQLKPYTEADPSIGYDNLHLGLGTMSHHTVNTPLCYIAEDGKTAKYMAYDCGEQTVGKPDGTMDAYFVFGLLYADLVKEDGEWKIWHLALTHDHSIPVGISYGDAMPIEAPQQDDPLVPEFGTPTVQHTVYEPFFGWEYLYQDMPKPYYTYTDRASYGPEGELGYPYYERERREV
jgi:hypothetical protein